MSSAARPLHVVHAFATFAPGGPQVRTARLIDALGDSFRHSVLPMDGNASALERVTRRELVTIVDAERGRHGGTLRYARWLGAKIASLAPDLLITYNWGAMDAVLGARLRGIAPWIHAEDGFGPDEAVSFKRRRVWMRRLLLPRASAVIVPSRNLERIARSTWRLAAEQVRFIANGIDLDHFLPGDAAELRRELGLQPGDVLIGTVAHLRAEKDPLALLEGFSTIAAAHPRAHLLFVGDGVLGEELTRRTAELGLTARVHRLGFVPNPLACYRAMDVFALSSRTEQMPISLLEAMGCAKAVVSTGVGDVALMVAEANRAYVVPPGDRDAYARALGALCGDAQLRAALGRANRAEAERHFDQRAMVETYRRLWSGLP
ncbi:MAG: glycosyltransferase [Planctomycetes bacterium]|nr:glycosyltransferase [Planctomycetota bacterium]